MKDRGFNKLKGKTIKEVDAGALNQVLLLCDDGTVFEVNTEVVQLGIIEVSLVRRKEKLDKLPKRTKPVPVMAAWPYPEEAKVEKPKKKETVFKGGSRSFDEKKGRGPTSSEVVKPELKKPPKKKKT